MVVVALLYSKFILKPKVIALAFAELGVKLSPGSPKAWWDLYQARRRVGGRSWNQCLASLECGLERAPGSKCLLKEYVRVQLGLYIQNDPVTRLHSAQRALARYDAVVSDDPELAAWRCEAALLGGDFERAIDEVEWMVERPGIQVSHLLTLAIVAVQIPNSSVGRELLREIAEYESNIPNYAIVAAQAEAILIIANSLEQEWLSKDVIDDLVKKMERACEVCNWNAETWITNVRHTFMMRRNHLERLPETAA